jgi:glycosyltransferase involved in cell wall biosynthesis
MRLIPRLREHGFETTVLLPSEPGNAADRLRSAGIDVVTMPLHRLRNTIDPRTQARYVLGFWPEVLALRRLIRERQIDLVQINGMMNTHGGFAAQLTGTPVVWMLLSTIPSMLQRRVTMPLVTRMADVLMTSAVEVAHAHPGAMSMDERLVTFYPPCDTTMFRPRPEERAEVRREWGISEDALVLGTVANITPVKGIDLLIQSLSEVRQTRPDARLVLLGGEPETHRDYSRRLRDQMRSLNLREGVDVLFLGSRSDVDRQLQGYDIFVMGSTPNSEATPTAIMEAMATEIPVVATNSGGTGEAVIDGVTGFLVPTNGVNELASGIACIAADPELYRKMGHAARQIAVERFDITISTMTHVRAFEMALRSRARGA